ncbi:MAG: hypothetical protein RRY29_01760 [Desulfovibrionaceae bacterium]
MHIEVENLGPGPATATSTSEPYDVPDGADVQTLLHLQGRSTEEVMLVFVDGVLAQLHTPLYAGARVTLCACICGG